jgi:hypothetical protein
MFTVTFVFLEAISLWIKSWVLFVAFVLISSVFLLILRAMYGDTAAQISGLGSFLAGISVFVLEIIIHKTNGKSALRNAR